MKREMPSNSKILVLIQLAMKILQQLMRSGLVDICPAAHFCIQDTVDICCTTNCETVFHEKNFQVKKAKQLLSNLEYSVLPFNYAIFSTEL